MSKSLKQLIEFWTDSNVGIELAKKEMLKGAIEMIKLLSSNNYPLDATTKEIKQLLTYESLKSMMSELDYMVEIRNDAYRKGQIQILRYLASKGCDISNLSNYQVDRKLAEEVLMNLDDFSPSLVPDLCLYIMVCGQYDL